MSPSRQMYGQENVASNKVNVDVLHRNEERKICREVLCGRIKSVTRCEKARNRGENESNGNV